MQNSSERPSTRYERLYQSDSAERLRQTFHSLNPGMILLWRLGLGRWADLWPTVGGRVMVLQHRGRMTGRRYLTPLNYHPADDAVYCVAAFGERTDWYRNVMTNPEAVVWLPRERWWVRAADVSHDHNRLDIMRDVLLGSGMAAPSFGLHPRTMSDDELSRATEGHLLVRFDLDERFETGPEDLAWVWVPIGALAAVVAAAASRRGRS